MTPTTPDGRMPPPLLRRWRLGLVVVAVLGLLLAAGVLLGHVSGVAALTAEELRRWLHAAGHAAPFLFIAIFLALNTIGLPAPILGAAAGITFGAVQGTAITLTALTLTACVQFLLARHLGGERLRQRLAQQLGRIGHVLQRRGALTIAGLRLLPAPFSEFNLAAGLTTLRVRDFALGTVIGCAPKAFAWAGLADVLMRVLA